MKEGIDKVKKQEHKEEMEIQKDKEEQMKEDIVHADKRTGGGEGSG